MRLELFHITNNWDEALIIKSYLEFYGLDPIIPDYLQLSLNPFKIMALGGIRIHLPESQIDLARDIRASQSDYEITDYDPTPKSLIGMKVRTFTASLFWLFPIIAAFAAIFPPLWIAVVWMALFPWLHMTLYWWLCAWIICIPLHARYIALPRLRKDTA